MPSPLDYARRLWTPPATRRLLAAYDAAPIVEVASSAPAAPLSIVPLEPGTTGAGSRRRAWIDEQRNGIRTPWVPVGLRWNFEDMEPIWQNAEIGNMDPLARACEAFRSEGVIAGLMDVTCAPAGKIPAFDGDPYLCELLSGVRAKFDLQGRCVRPGKKGLFAKMHPRSALLDLLFTARLAGMAAGEYVDDPKQGGIPVLHTRDLHRLRYDWGERCWKYRGQKDEYIVDPGNGRWIFFCPKSTHRPWRSGAWLPLMLAFVVMITSTYDAARFQAKSADPLKVIELPDEAPPDEVDRCEEFVSMWWERSPGIVLRYGAKADLVETNGVGHHIFGANREWAKQQINFTLRGSMGTAGESEGIFNDEESSLEVADSLIEDLFAALAECLNDQGIPQALVRMGQITRHDDAPTCSWNTRSPARMLAEANAAGEVADNVLKLNAAALADGKRVNAPAFIAQCGVTVPWVDIVTADPEPTLAPPEFTTADPVVDQTDATGSLE